MPGKESEELIMMDLDNIPDTQTEAEELEEVVMGLIINSDKPAAWRMPR